MLLGYSEQQEKKQHQTPSSKAGQCPPAAGPGLNTVTTPAGCHSSRAAFLGWQTWPEGKWSKASLVSAVSELCWATEAKGHQTKPLLMSGNSGWGMSSSTRVFTNAKSCRAEAEPTYSEPESRMQPESHCRMSAMGRSRNNTINSKDNSKSRRHKTSAVLRKTALTINSLILPVFFKWQHGEYLSLGCG